MSEFKAWMAAMGLNGKQVAHAGDLIGMGRSTALLSYRGERRLTKTELLAMTAVSAEFPSWSSIKHSEIAASGQVVRAAKTAFYSVARQ